MSKIITPILFFIAAIGLFFSYISPAYDTLLAYMEREERLDQAIIKADQLKVKYDEMIERYRSISRTDMDKLNKLLPDAVDVVRLIIDFDTLAAVNDLTISNFEIPQTEYDAPKSGRAARTAVTDNESPVLQAPFALTMTGRYPDLKAFVMSAEQSLTLLDVVKMQITAGDETARDARQREDRYVVTLQAYALKAEL